MSNTLFESKKIHFRHGAKSPARAAYLNSISYTSSFSITSISCFAES